MRTILLGVVGSRAYGLDHAGSDTDRLGVFAYPTEELLGLAKPPESLVTSKPDQTLHELGKFLSLVLKCNPTVTELLWLDDDGQRTGYEIIDEELGYDLLDLAQSLLSAPYVSAAYGGYARQQFIRLDRRERVGDDPAGRDHKHMRHCIRLLRQGAELLEFGSLQVRVRDPEFYFGLEALSTDEFASLYRHELAEFDRAAARTILPEKPDTKAANDYLVRVRRELLSAA